MEHINQQLHFDNYSDDGTKKTRGQRNDSMIWLIDELIVDNCFVWFRFWLFSQAVKIVKHTLEIIHLVTGQNPLQVVSDAVMKSGPREDSTRIGSAGVVRRQAVDVSPLRRVNQAIYLITTGARNNAFRNIKTISECLADELINAANDNQNSFAIKKKDEIERVAKANR